jgi:ribosomal protein L32
MPKLQQKQQKTSNNGASNKGTKRSHPAKIAPTSKDKSKKVSSLPVIICTYVLYRDYVRLRTCYTYVDIRVIRIVYVYVAMFY